jgi:hypothetical protein
MRQTTKRALFLCVMLLAAASGKLAAQSNFMKEKPSASLSVSPRAAATMFTLS